MRKRLFVLVSAALIGACAPSFQPNKIQRMRFEPAQQAERRGDHATALEIYEDAAEDGIAYAQYRLARLYENGKGTDQDYVQAIERAIRVIKTAPDLQTGIAMLQRASD